MMNKIVKSQKALEKSMSKTKSNTSKMAQVVCIILSSIACWILSGVVYLTVMYLEQYPTEMLTWVIITAVPLNSLVNPLVFVFTTMKKRHSEKK